MKVLIKQANLRGDVTVPCSKSEAHRIIICAAFADKPTVVRLSGISDDISATADCVSALGAHVERTDCGFIVTPIAEINPQPTLLCRESGSTLRFLLPVAAALGSDATFVLEGRLPSRPLSPLDNEMLRHGTSIVKDGNTLELSGKMTGNSFELEAGVSSQFISGILMALPLMGGGRLKLLGKKESAGYIDMTLDAMREFGVNAYFEGDSIVVPDENYKSPGELAVGGDWSSAAFWVSAGALSDEGITCHGVDFDSLQGDRAIVDIVSAFGADLTKGENCVTVKKSPLRGITLDAHDVPDLVPVVSALSAGAAEETNIKGAARLRLKESDRLSAMHHVLSSLGANVCEMEDGLRIIGGNPLHGGIVDSHGDHRIAMSAAVAAMLCNGEVIINGAECVSKSYVSFWEDYKSLGGKIEILNEK